MKTQKKTSSKNLIMTIYLYFFMGVGLIMTVTGLYGLGQNYYKSQLFEKYPLGGYEQRCDYLSQPVSLMKGVSDSDIEESSGEAKRIEKQIEDCEANLDEERSARKVTDLYNSLIILGIGIVLFGSHLFVNVQISRR